MKFILNTTIALGLIGIAVCFGPVNAIGLRKLGDMAPCVIASARGDSLGRVTEFIPSTDKIFTRYPNGVRSPQDFLSSDWMSAPVSLHNKGIAPYTDDTRMAILVMRALIEARRGSLSLDQTMGVIARFFVDDMQDTAWGWAALFRAPGISTMNAVHKLESLQTTNTTTLGWWKVGRPESGGCGSVMRAYPFGLVFADNLLKAKEWAVAHSLLTHAHPWAQAACAAMAVGTGEAFNTTTRTKKKHQAIIQAMIDAAREYDTSTALKMEKALALAEEAKSKLAAFNNDYAAALKDTEFRAFHEHVFKTFEGWRADDAIAATVFVFALYSENLEQALYCSVHTPGDSDSIASMAGALVGAYVKNDLLEQVQQYKDDLEGYQELCGLASQARRSAQKENELITRESNR